MKSSDKEILKREASCKFSDIKELLFHLPALVAVFRNFLFQLCLPFSDMRCPIRGDRSEKHDQQRKKHRALTVCHHTTERGDTHSDRKRVCTQR